MIELLTLILCIITGGYAFITFRILKANEKVVEKMAEQTLSLQRPYITISPNILPGLPIMMVRIANTGKTPANNLRLEIDKDFYKYGERKEERNIANFTAFRETIDMFAPGAELLFDLAQGFKIFGQDSDPNIMPKVFTITAKYEFFGEKVSEKNIIDLNPYHLSNQPRDLLIGEIGNIRETIEKIIPKLGNSDRGTEEFESDSTGRGDLTC